MPWTGHSPGQNKPLPIRHLPFSARWLGSCLDVFSSAGSGKQTRNGRTRYGTRCTPSQVEERGPPRICWPGLLRSVDGIDRVSEPNHSSPEECDSPAFQGSAERERCGSERLGARTSAHPKWRAIGWRLPGAIVISVLPGKVRKELQNGPKFAQGAQPCPSRAARRGLRSHRSAEGCGFHLGSKRVGR